ncbi:hypothetical protein K0M31_012037 [Melipona bicolor]|uniref:Uncharacterized protein n=1 Tax=Melipona bicolor TaxID=60889 RepID=A0AA40KVG0_9HYME|nr:hypothetical protein K0M31_012037 [Melipona bicolor]
MRKQGLVIEVMDHKDVETIGKCGLDKIGFLVERPKKVDPSIIIYDVERDYREEELKEDLIKKNLECSSDDDDELDKLHKMVPWWSDQLTKLKKKITMAKKQLLRAIQATRRSAGESACPRRGRRSRGTASRPCRYARAVGNHRRGRRNRALRK